ncbi:sigma E protease regulator RseP [Pseudomonas sp. N040]|uniref:sigma E protease regulator RseP n=1 Tax=Pseudomonas sp. N040 TaxID=2785325 RepID=UPI0018A269E0|nr:sigma E protease regulator RseP [Pseudomonas sp. N040]MBF7729706.1 sigma E protease regulator RseP [Pseudomonas sp. N040]MBW7013348.1 sigma E protease regulator RseP [Pseudomonas sp. N040]
MSALYMLFGTLIALGVLVTFHEFGHFWVARRCGVKVLRFSIGFGLPLFSWRDRLDTEYVIAAIPLGGYVKMLDEREAEVPPELLGQAFNRKSLGQRAAIVAAGPVANFILALLFFWVIALLGSQQVRPVVGEIAPASPAALAGLQPGEEFLAVNGEPTGDWSAVNLQLVRHLGESTTLELTLRQPDSSLEVQRPLAVKNWLKGAEDPDPISALGIVPWRPTISSVISELDPAGPAAAAGLQAGDRLLALDGEDVSDWQKLVARVRDLPGKTVALTFERSGQVEQMQVHLSAKAEGGQFAGYLGAGVTAPEWPADMLREVSYGPLEAIGQALGKTWAMSVLTLDSLKKMLLGELSVKNLSGPITIAKVAGATAESGLGEFLNFLAYLSISLGVLNLLPVPILDGGHLMFYLVEWVRGRPLSERLQALGMQMGIALVVALMVLALVNDVGRL